MEGNLFIKEINLLDKQIQSYSEEKNKYIIKKQFSINGFLKTIDNNNSQISNIKKKIESDKKVLSSIKSTRENKLKSLFSQIESLQNNIKILENKNISTNNNDLELLKKEIQKLSEEKQKHEKKLKKTKKILKKLEKKQNEENERNNMLKEEYFSCKKLLIILTSKIESHSEFIKTLCKTRNALSSSLEKLNEIEPDNSEFSNNVIEMNKLAEMIYSYCNEYLEFNTNYDEFIDKIKNQDDIEKVIDYLQEISKYKIPRNLYEYTLIALCRIMTYEKILDIRMNFINNIDENEKKNINKNDKSENKENGIINENENKNNNNKEINDKKDIKKDNELNKYIYYKKQYELNILKLKECEKNLNNKEKTYNKINNDIQENINSIKNMNNDLLLITKYTNKLLNKINKNEKDIINRQNEYLQLIDKLNEEIISSKEKIVKKNFKLSEKTKKYEEKINELIQIRNSIITSNNEYKTNEINDNLIQMEISPLFINKTNKNQQQFININNNKNINENINEKNNGNNINIENNDNENEKNSLLSITELIQSNNNEKTNKENIINNNINDILSNININLSQQEFISLQNIKPLIKNVSVLKRQIIHIKQKIYENYNPVIGNKSTLPKDYNFKKYFLYLDNNLILHFQKTSSTDRSINLSPTSILRIEIPIFTKNLIFLQKIYSNLNKKLNLDSTKKINEYFIKEKKKIMYLYLENFYKSINNDNNKEINFENMNDIIDEKIFDEKYREALLINKQYMINIYLKPDEDTKIEILFNARNDFKNWINGLDELISNYSKIKEIICRNNKIFEEFF